MKFRLPEYRICFSFFYDENASFWTKQISLLNNYEATSEARALKAHTKGGKFTHRCEKPRLLLRLARTHLRMKYYDIAFPRLLKTESLDNAILVL